MLDGANRHETPWKPALFMLFTSTRSTSSRLYGLYIYRFTYMLTEVIKSVYPISGIGVYFSQGENVKVHGVALKCGYLMKKYLKSTEW